MSLAYELYYESAVERLVREGHAEADARFRAHNEAARLTSQFTRRGKPDTKYEGSWAHQMEARRR